VSVATFYVGDAFDVMAGIPDASIDLIVTSPPFLALRSYLPADHPDKHLEIGSEATPAAFLSTLLALTREWRRVLAPHGSLCVELGDTYSGNNETGWHRSGNEAVERYRNLAAVAPTIDKGRGWPLDKSLCLLPTLYPASLAYGRNLLHPDDTLDPWRVRNLIVWHRPNPPVGALGDKCRPSTSYVTIACMRRDRWFDLDAERTDYSANSHPRTAQGVKSQQRTAKTSADGNRATLADRNNDGAGAPPLDYWQLDEDDPTEHQAWTIPTQPYAGAHYATFPIALPRRLIRLMCPQHVCRVCGEPRRRIVGKTPEYEAFRAAKSNMTKGQHTDATAARHLADKGGVGSLDNGEDAGARGQLYETLGWSDCGHDNYRRGIVLDPFAGSGTTLAAATEQGRDAVGIDIDADNYWLARQRIGMFLQEADTPEPGTQPESPHNPTGNPRFRVGYQHGNPNATGDRKNYGDP